MTATTGSTKSISFGELRKNNFMDDLELHDAIVLIHAESIFNPHV